MNRVYIKKNVEEEVKQREEQNLHRPYIRKSVRDEVESRAEKNEKGQFLDANTGEPIEGQYDLGHKAGHEYWREEQIAKEEGLSQEEFNDKMNNADYYQIEDPHENRSHTHEMPKEESAEESSEIANGIGSETECESESQGENAGESM